MFEPVEVYQKDGKVLKIFHDCDAENPRDWDNLGTMVCWHRRYNLGDKHRHDSPEEFQFALAEDIVGDTDKIDNMTPEQREKIVRENTIILPLYLYDHTARCMSTSSFVGRAHHAEWDSGQVGWIYVTKEKVRQEYGVKRITKKIRDRVISVLKAEVETYSQWMEGNVYGFVLEDPEGNEIDSCWGFYGYDFANNGIVEQAGEEWKSVIN